MPIFLSGNVNGWVNASSIQLGVLDSRSLSDWLLLHAFWDRKKKQLKIYCFWYFFLAAGWIPSYLAVFQRICTGFSLLDADHHFVLSLFYADSRPSRGFVVLLTWRNQLELRVSAKNQKPKWNVPTNHALQCHRLSPTALAFHEYVRSS